jgi:hypothetical protein
MEVNGQLHAPAALPPGKEPSDLSVDKACILNMLEYCYSKDNEKPDVIREGSYCISNVFSGQLLRAKQNCIHAVTS